MIAIVDYGMGNLDSVAKACRFLGFEVKVTSSPAVIRRAAGVIFPGVGAFGAAVKELKKRRLIDPLWKVVEDDKPFLGLCLGLQLLFEESEESPGVKGLSILPGRVRRLKPGRDLKIPHMGWNQIHRVGRTLRADFRTRSRREKPEAEPSRGAATKAYLPKTDTSRSGNEGAGRHTGFAVRPRVLKAALKVSKGGPGVRFHSVSDDPLLNGVPDGAFMYFVHSYVVDSEEESLVSAWTEYGQRFISVIWNNHRIWATQFHPEKSQRWGLKLLGNFLRMVDSDGGGRRSNVGRLL